jgi:GT2 family glycosyltransferase
MGIPAYSGLEEPSLAAISRVIAVVLAWNHLEDTLECLESLVKSDSSQAAFSLVDNASSDDTLQVVAERFPEVELIHSDQNLGVSGGYNLGMQCAVEKGYEFILTANNDIQVHPEMIANLVRVMEEHPEAGMVMPKIFHYFGDRTRLWCTGGKWRAVPPMVKMTGLNQPDSPRDSQVREISFAPSCVLLLRRAAVEKAGYFDTGYFFYHDDWDYCIRIRQAGYKIFFAPEAKMWHKVSLSTQNSDKPRQWWVYYGRSTVRFYVKNFNRWYLFWFSAWFLIRETLKGNFRRLAPFLSGLFFELALEGERAKQP